MRAAGATLARRPVVPLTSRPAIPSTRALTGYIRFLVPTDPYPGPEGSGEIPPPAPTRLPSPLQALGFNSHGGPASCPSCEMLASSPSVWVTLFHTIHQPRPVKASPSKETLQNF